MTGIHCPAGLFQCMSWGRGADIEARPPARPEADGREDKAWHAQTNFQNYWHATDASAGQAARDARRPHVII